MIISSPPTSNPVVGNLNSKRPMEDEERGGVEVRGQMFESSHCSFMAADKNPRTEGQL